MDEMEYYVNGWQVTIERLDWAERFYADQPQEYGEAWRKRPSS